MHTRLLTLQQAADRLSMSYQWIRREISEGNLPAVKLGRVYRIDPADLDAYVERRLTKEPDTY